MFSGEKDWRWQSSGNSVGIIWTLIIVGGRQKIVKLLQLCNLPRNETPFSNGAQREDSFPRLALACFSATITYSEAAVLMSLWNSLPLFINFPELNAGLEKDQSRDESPLKIGSYWTMVMPSRVLLQTNRCLLNNGLLTRKRYERHFEKLQRYGGRSPVLICTMARKLQKCFQRHTTTK